MLRCDGPHSVCCNSAAPMGDTHKGIQATARRGSQSLGLGTLGAQAQAGPASYPPKPWSSLSMGGLRTGWAVGGKSATGGRADLSRGGRGQVEHRDSCLFGWPHPKSLCTSPTAPQTSALASNLSCFPWVLSPQHQAWHVVGSSGKEFGA